MKYVMTVQSHNTEHLSHTHCCEHLYHSLISQHMFCPHVLWHNNNLWLMSLLNLL